MKLVDFGKVVPFVMAPRFYVRDYDVTIVSVGQWHKL